MKKLLFGIFTLMTFCKGMAQSQISIIPKPQSISEHQGTFVLSNNSYVKPISSGTEKSAAFLQDYLKKFYKFNLRSITRSTSTGEITLLIKKNKKAVRGSYELNVTNNGISIVGNDEEGVFYGIQTLIQLLPTDFSTTSFTIPQVAIKDYPRYQYRGLMLDCGRNFWPVDFVKQYIDFIALHKMNTFHWHLTEDQGWRIEIKKYPKLTEVGGWRNGTIIGHYPGTGNDSVRTGGFYTQDQIRDIVKYAEDRYITVIPEIEMPGHSSAAIAAYPELSCFPDSSTDIGTTPWAGSREGKQVQQTWGVFKDVYAPTDYTFHFIENVLDEVMQLFPSKYIHIGGDECPKTIWKESAFCQNLIRQHGLKNEEGLQSYFIQKIEKYLNSKGRNIIGWDEILEGGLAPNATIMSWRGEEGGIAAAKQKHDVIMTPGGYVYFDHSQRKNDDSLTIGGYLPLQQVYKYDPNPKELTAQQHKYILGAQANLWTEYMRNTSKVEYMLFPRLSALSEVLWTKKDKKDYSNFKTRLNTQLARYQEWGINYCKEWDNQPDK